MRPLWMTIGKATLSETRVMWYADDAYSAQEERRSYLRRANRGGVVDSGVVAGSGELPGSSSVGDGHAPGYRAPQVEQSMITMLY